MNGHFEMQDAETENLKQEFKDLIRENSAMSKEIQSLTDRIIEMEAELGEDNNNIKGKVKLLGVKKTNTFTGMRILGLIGFIHFVINICAMILLTYEAEGPKCDNYLVSTKILDQFPVTSNDDSSRRIRKR